MAFNLDDFLEPAPVAAPNALGFNLDDFLEEPAQPAGLVSDSGRWRVEDGDTVIDQQSGEIFRLSGMNTPETAHPEKGWNSPEYGADAASRRTLDYVNRMEAQGGLQLQRGGTDAYNRTLASAPGLNEELIRTGNAVQESRAPDAGAEEARLQRLMTWDQSSAVPPEAAEAAGQRLENTLFQRATERPPQYTTGGTLERSVARGFDQTGMLLGAAAEAVGQGVGWRGLEDAGRGLADRQEAAVRVNAPEVPSWDDVHTLGDFGTYALERVGEQAANLALMATGAGAGAMGAKALGQAALVGRMAGAGAATYPLGVGDIQQELHAGGIRAPGTALLTAIPYAALEGASFEAVFGRLFGANKVVAKNLYQAIGKEAAKAVGIAAPSEGLTEYNQELLVLTARAMHDPSFEIFSDENIARLKNAAVAGATVGGVLGGAGGAVHGLGYELPGRESQEAGAKVEAAMRRLAQRPRDQLDASPPSFDLADYVVEGTTGGTTGGGMPADTSVPYSYGAGVRSAELSGLGAAATPTAAEATAPALAQDGTLAEPIEDIAAAQDAVLEGRKPAAYDATGRYPTTPGLVKVLIPKAQGGGAYYIPSGKGLKQRRAQLRELHAAGKQAEILGYLQNKQEIPPEATVSVVSVLNPQGRHESDQVVDVDKVNDAVAAARQQMAPGGSVQVGSVAQEAQRRTVETGEVPYNAAQRRAAHEELKALRRKLNEAEAAAAAEGRALSVKDREIVHDIVRLQMVAYSAMPIDDLKSMVANKVQKANAYLASSKNDTWGSEGASRAASMRELANLIMSEAKGFAAVVKARTGEVVPTEWDKSPEPKPLTEQEKRERYFTQAIAHLNDLIGLHTDRAELQRRGASFTPEAVAEREQKVAEWRADKARYEQDLAQERGAAQRRTDGRVPVRRNGQTVYMTEQEMQREFRRLDATRRVYDQTDPSQVGEEGLPTTETNPLRDERDIDEGARSRLEADDEAYEAAARERDDPEVQALLAQEAQRNERQGQEEGRRRQEALLRPEQAGAALKAWRRHGQKLLDLYESYRGQSASRVLPQLLASQKKKLKEVFPGLPLPSAWKWLGQLYNARLDTELSEVLQPELEEDQERADIEGMDESERAALEDSVYETGITIAEPMPPIEIELRQGGKGKDVGELTTPDAQQVVRALKHIFPGLAITLDGKTHKITVESNDIEALADRLATEPNKVPAALKKLTAALVSGRNTENKRVVLKAREPVEKHSEVRVNLQGLADFGKHLLGGFKRESESTKDFVIRSLLSGLGFLNDQYLTQPTLFKVKGDEVVYEFGGTKITWDQVFGRIRGSVQLQDAQNNDPGVRAAFADERAQAKVVEGLRTALERAPDGQRSAIQRQLNRAEATLAQLQKDLRLSRRQLAAAFVSKPWSEQEWSSSEGFDEQSVLDGMERLGEGGREGRGQGDVAVQNADAARTARRMADADQAFNLADRARGGFVEPMGAETAVPPDSTPVFDRVGFEPYEKALGDAQGPDTSAIPQGEEDQNRFSKTIPAAGTPSTMQGGSDVVEEPFSFLHNVNEKVIVHGGKVVQTLGTAVREVLKLLGLTNRVILADEAGLADFTKSLRDAADRAEKRQPTRAANLRQWADHLDNAMGSRFAQGKRGWIAPNQDIGDAEMRIPVILLSAPHNTSITERVEALSHELGHLIQFAVLDQITAKAKSGDTESQAILDELKKGWEASGPADTRNVFTEWFANQFVAYVARKHNFRGVFNEAIGDARAPAMVAGVQTNARAGDANFRSERMFRVRMLFKKLDEMLRKMWSFLKGKYRIDRSYQDFLEAWTGVHGAERPAPSTEYGRRFMRVMGELYTSPYLPEKNSDGVYDFTPAQVQQARRAVQGPVSRVLGARRAGKVLDSAEKVHGALRWAHGRVTQSADAYLRDNGLEWLADYFSKRPDVRHARRVEPIPDKIRRLTGEHMRKANAILAQFAVKKWYDPILGMSEGRVERNPAYDEAVNALITHRPDLQGLSPAARQIVTAVRQYFADMIEPLRLLGVDVSPGSNNYRQNYAPISYKVDDLLSRKDEFLQLLENPVFGNIPPPMREEIWRNMVESNGSELAVGFSNQRVASWGPQHWAVLRDFIEDDLATMMLNYTRSAFKYAITADYFGAVGFDPQGNRQLNPLGALEQRMYNARQAGPQNGGIEREVYDRVMTRILPALLGHVGTDIDPRWRKFQGLAITLQNISKLGLAVLSSLPDFAGVFTRGGVRAALRGIREVMTSRRTAAEIREMGELIGAIQDGLTEHAMNDTANDMFMGALYRRWNERFFRATRLHWFTNVTRVMALSTGRQFLKDNAAKALAGDVAAQKKLAELGVPAQSVRDWVRAGMPMPPPSTSPDYGKHGDVFAALNQFVDEAIIRPDASQRPAWASDPHWAMFWHLKSFMYGMHETILRRLWSQLLTEKGLRKLLPVAMFGLTYLPLAAAGYELRRRISWWGEPPDYASKEGADYLWEVVQRSGAPGIMQMVVDMDEAEDRGKLSIMSLMGPSVGMLEEFITKDFTDAFARQVPGLAQSPRLRAGFQLLMDDWGIPGFDLTPSQYDARERMAAGR